MVKPAAHTHPQINTQEAEPTLISRMSNTQIRLIMADPAEAIITNMASRTSDKGMEGGNPAAHFTSGVSQMSMMRPTSIACSLASQESCMSALSGTEALVNQEGLDLWSLSVWSVRNRSWSLTCATNST